MRLLAITPPAAIADELDSGLVPIWLDAGAGALGLAVVLREPGRGGLAILADPRFRSLRRTLAEHEVASFVSLAPAELLVEETVEALRRATPTITGVQLRGDPSPEQCAHARACLPEFSIGRSVHGRTPTAADVDYTCLAPIHPPNTASPGVRKQAIGLEGLRRWTAARSDVFALGGIGPDNACACLDAGARGLAAIRLFFGPRSETAQNVASVCQAFARAAPDHGPPTQARGRGAEPPQGS